MQLLLSPKGCRNWERLPEKVIAPLERLLPVSTREFPRIVIHTVIAETEYSMKTRMLIYLVVMKTVLSAIHLRRVFPKT